MFQTMFRTTKKGVNGLAVERAPVVNFSVGGYTKLPVIQIQEFRTLPVTKNTRVAMICIVSPSCELSTFKGSNLGKGNVLKCLGNPNSRYRGTQAMDITHPEYRAGS